MSSPSWKAAMVQLLYRCWIFSNFLLLATNFGTADADATNLGCHEIEPTMDFAKWKDCVFDQEKYVGDPTKPILLDFSTVTQEEFNAFFAKATSPTTLYAAIKIVGNQNLLTLNFGKINKWSGKIASGSPAIDIRNNLNLTTIEWKLDEFDPSVKGGGPPQILFYNNPRFDPKSIKDQMKKIKHLADKATSYIQEEKNECTLQDPLKPNVSLHLSQDFLNLCKSIKGDVKLENVKITGELKLADNGTCVHLVNVDVKKGKITMPGVNQGQLDCPKSGIKSIIRENPGLCYEQMDEVANYFREEIRDYGIIRIDEESCAITCGNSHVFHKYTFCKSINGEIDIGRWFTDTDQKIKRLKLEKAEGILKIVGSQLTTLDLVQLTSAGGFEIIDNKKLETLKLPQLRTVETLTITGNPLLTVDKFQELKFVVKGSSTVECHSSAATPVTDAAVLRLCTHIKGDLILSGLKNDIKPSDAPIKEVEGCLTVQNTELTNLDFLSGTTFTCQGGHKAIDNAKLCVPKFIKMAVTGAARKEKCGKTCYSLSEGNCVIFSGDLTIDSNTPANQLKDLTTIQGSLKIEGTNRVTVDFPNLQEISSPKAPALHISNNAKLETIKMPKISKIAVADGQVPVINILDNPKLKDVDFVPSSQRASCKDPNAAACIYAGAKDAHKTEKEPDESSRLLMIVAWCVAGISIVVCLILSVVIFRKKLSAIIFKKKLKLHVSTVFYWFDEYVKGTEMTAPQFLTLTAMTRGMNNQAEMSTLRQELRASKKSYPNPTLDMNIHYTSLEVSDYIRSFFGMLNDAHKRIGYFYMQQTDFANMIPPVNLCTHEILHFGTGYMKNFKQEAKMDYEDDTDFQTVRMDKKPEKPAVNAFAKSMQIAMEYPTLTVERTGTAEGYFEANDKRNRSIQKIETEITEVLLPEVVAGHFEDLVKIPWYQLIGMAYENNLMIHTDKAEYLMLIYLLMNTYAELKKSEELKYPSEMENYYERMYLLFRTAFKPDTYPMDVYFLWIYLTTELFVKQIEKSEWYTATLKQLEATPKNVDLVKKFAGQLDRLKSNMDDICEMNKKIGNGQDGEKISLGKTAKGEDVIETVHKKEPKIELGLFCTAIEMIGSKAPIYKPTSNWPADPFFDICICEKPGTNKFLVHNLKGRRERMQAVKQAAKVTKKSAPPPTPAASASPAAAASAEDGDDKKKNGPKKPRPYVDDRQSYMYEYVSAMQETARPPTHRPTTQPPAPPPQPEDLAEGYERIEVNPAQVPSYHKSKEQK